MKLVAARFSSHYHLPAFHAPVLCGIDAGQQFELLNVFDGGPEGWLAGADIVVVNAVDGELIGCFRRAGHIDSPAETQY